MISKQYKKKILKKKTIFLKIQLKSGSEHGIINFLGGADGIPSHAIVTKRIKYIFASCFSLPFVLDIC